MKKILFLALATVLSFSFLNADDSIVLKSYKMAYKGCQRIDSGKDFGKKFNDTAQIQGTSKAFETTRGGFQTNFESVLGDIGISRNISYFTFFSNYDNFMFSYVPQREKDMKLFRYKFIELFEEGDNMKESRDRGIFMPTLLGGYGEGFDRGIYNGKYSVKIFSSVDFVDFVMLNRDQLLSNSEADFGFLKTENQRKFVGYIIQGKLDLAYKLVNDTYERRTNDREIVTVKKYCDVLPNLISSEEKQRKGGK